MASAAIDAVIKHVPDEDAERVAVNELLVKEHPEAVPFETEIVFAPVPLDPAVLTFNA